MSAHVDRFAAQALPPREQFPEMLFDLPGLQFPSEFNAADALLDRHVREGRGDRRCIVWPGGSWSYAQLHEHANRIARVLVDDMQAVPGNRVLLRGFNSPMLAAAWFATIKVGAIAVTTMPLYKSAELQTIYDKAQVTHVLCDERLEPDVQFARARRRRVRTWGDGDLESAMARAAPKFENVRTAAEDVAIIGFTSGTTGKPKAAAHFHRDLLATCATYGTHVLALQPDDLITGSPPLGFTFGLGGLLLFPLYAGASTLLLEKAPPEPLLEAISQHKVTVVFTAPVAYRAMTALIDEYDITSLRACVSAGETLPKLVWEGWHEKTGLKILDGIGSTEMLHIFIGSPQERVVAGSTGQTVPGYVAQIHDDDGNEMPRGEIGRLAVKGPTGCKYLHDDRQAVYVRNGWNYPGDAYREDADGYFWYVARADDMIIASGYNISGPEIEQALLGHPDVAECAVVAKPDLERQTNIVKAYVVLREGGIADSEKTAELQRFLRETIAAFKVPREIEFVSALPRTETGKVQRFRLRERAAEE